MSGIQIGTSSWHFDAWRGVFYPEQASSKEYLQLYSRRFPTVEVNTSFYAMPRAEIVQRWATSVPSGFTFCLKWPRSITHDKRLLDCQEESRLFLERLTLLGDNGAPSFLQFPPDFSRAQHGRALADYLDWLAGVKGTASIGVEVRAPDLMTPAFARFLAVRGFAFVLVDRINTPDLFDVWLEAIAAESTPTFAIIRWIGDDKNGPTGDRELSVLRDRDLARWSARIKQLWDLGTAVFGYMHNPYEGHAPASVQRLNQRVQEIIPLPAWEPAAPDQAPGDGSTPPDDHAVAAQLPLFG